MKLLITSVILRLTVNVTAKEGHLSKEEESIAEVVKKLSDILLIYGKYTKYGNILKSTSFTWWKMFCITMDIVGHLIRYDSHNRSHHRGLITAPSEKIRN